MLKPLKAVWVNFYANFFFTPFKDFIVTMREF